MDLSGEHRFDVPRALLWEALLDRRVLEATIPGCERLIEIAPGSYDLTMRVGMAALRGSYRGTVRVLEPRPQESYRIAVSGNGLPGTVNGNAVITLRDDGTGATVLSYQGEFGAQGVVARLGSRPLVGAAKLLIAQFFRALERRLGAASA